MLNITVRLKHKPQIHINKVTFSNATATVLQQKSNCHGILLPQRTQMHASRFVRQYRGLELNFPSCSLTHVKEAWWIASWKMINCVHNDSSCTKRAWVIITLSITMIISTVSVPFIVYYCGLLLGPGSPHIDKFSVFVCIFVFDLIFKKD